MYYLLFIFYLALFCVGINQIRFIKYAGLNKKTLTILFLIKVAAGLCIGWVSLTYYDGGDYGTNNMYGRQEYDLLVNDPLKFFTNLFDSGYENKYGGLFNSAGSFWHDLAGNCLYKLLGLFNLLSRGNYYINGLFLNVIGFIGHVALFRVFSNVYQSRPWPLIVGCFLLPSTLYFSSGLHKDNLVFTSICIFSYALYFSITQAVTFKRMMWLFLAGLLLFLIRSFVLVAMIPAAIALIVAYRRQSTWTAFAWIYGIFSILLISAVFLFPANQPLHIITKKQQDFLALKKARTQVAMDTLAPTLGSFTKEIPDAVQRGFFRPYIWETWRPYLFIPALEILFYIGLLLLIFFLKPGIFLSPHPFVLFGICISCILFLFIGFVIPNLGSIIRYRSLYLPFLVIPALANLSIIYYKK